MASNISPTSNPTSTKKTQACDACRLRKVKCNGAARCQQCSHLNLRCIYSAPRARARTSTKRGALISRYKAESQGSPTASSASPSLSDADYRIQSRDRWDRPFAESPNNANVYPRLPSLADVVPLDSPSMAHDTSYFLSYLPEYDKCVYPVNPVITTDEVRDAIQEMPVSQEACTFVYAMTATTMMLTPSNLDQSTLACIAYWVDQAILSKQPPNSGAEVSPRMIMTSEFLHIACMALHKQDVAFYYLREAITLGEMLRLDDQAFLATLPAIERARRQRLYGELYVHERYAAITCYRPTILAPLPAPPEYERSTPYHVHAGFSQIIQLFEVLDGEFITTWLASHTSHNPTTTLAWIEAKHREIDACPAGSDEAIAHLAVMQQSDLIVTKYWLRTMVWQLALSNRLLGSASSLGSSPAVTRDNPMESINHATPTSNQPSPADTTTSTDETPRLSLTFPLGLSRSLRNLVTRMSRKDIEVHGSGIQEKFFEITDTIANVMLASPNTNSPQSVQNMEDFVFLAKFVFSLPTLGAMQREILNDKLVRLQKRFPFVGTGDEGSVATPGSTASGAVGVVGVGIGPSIVGSPGDGGLQHQQQQPGQQGAMIGDFNAWSHRPPLGAAGSSPMG